MANKFKSGFIAIIGRPNVGKSTFLNNVLGRKVSIISPKPQTTRNQIRGIYTTDDCQMIFIDTPGIHKPQHELGGIMNRYALNTLTDVDVVLFIVDATQEFGTGDQFIINELKKIKSPVFLVFNKMDLIRNKGKLLENVVKFTNEYEFSEVLYISSVTGENINLLLDNIKNYLHEGPKYYPFEQVTDQSEQFVIAEIIREKVLLLTREEVPHSVAVVVDRMEEDEDLTHLINIHATIYVERNSQKKILIGNQGKMMKEIGTLARKEIVMLLGRKVFLDLWVKVEPDWRNKINQLRKLGYNLE